MENLNPHELWTLLLAAASAIVLLANAAEKISNAVRAAKAPNEEQNQRLDELEKWKEEMVEKQRNDLERFANIDSSNRVTQRALLALLDHGIDGNNIEQMQHAKEELQSHLINR